MNNTKDQPRFGLACDRNAIPWMQDRNLSIAFTSYDAGHLVFVGSNRNSGQFTVNAMPLERTTGLAISANGRSIWVATLQQLVMFHRHRGLERDPDYAGDAVFVPRVAYMTGDIDIHDIAIDGAGRPVFANTLFSCIATASGEGSFKPLWKPAFISKLAAEDRCHLNGLAIGDQGNPKYVTVVAQSDARGGWRDHRHNGGCVVDVASGEVVAAGLAMPHSPRLYRGKLWLLNSGEGYFGFVDLQSGHFERVCFCSGYARGLSFFGDYALIGLSEQRDMSFQGLALDEELAKKNVKAQCGFQVVDLRSGDVVHQFHILGGAVKEICDLVAIPDASEPGVVSLGNRQLLDRFEFESEIDGKGAIG